MTKFFGLFERVSTALEKANEKGEKREEFLTLRVEFTQRQLEDALFAAQNVQPKAQLPILVPRREILVALTLILSMLLVWQSGDGFFYAVHRSRAVKGAIIEEAAQIEAIVREIENDLSLTSEQRETLTQLLEEAQGQISQSETLEQAVSTLNTTTQELQAIYDPQVQQHSRELQQAGDQLSQYQGSPLEQFGQNLANGKFTAAANDLQNLNPENLSQTEREVLALQLNETANTLEASTQELSQELREAAEDIQNGDVQGAQQALHQASKTLSQTSQQINQSRTTQEAVSQLNQGQERLIEAGRIAEGRGDGGGEGVGGGDSGNEGQGQGSGSAGWGRGEGEGEISPGFEAGSKQISQGNAPGGGGEREANS